MRRFLAAQFAPVLRAWRNGYEAEVRRAAIAFFLLVSYVTEIPALCTSPGYGPQYAVIFGVVRLMV